MDWSSPIYSSNLFFLGLPSANTAGPAGLAVGIPNWDSWQNCSMVGKQDTGNTDLHSLVSSAPLAIMYYGEGTGERNLIMSGEEALFVWTRVYFLASVTVWSNFTQTELEAGSVHAFRLEYNTTYSLRFLEINGSTIWTFNMFTGIEEDYTAEEKYMLLSEALAGYVSVWQQNIVAGILAIFTAKALKEVGFRVGRTEEKPKNDQESHDIAGVYVESPMTGWELFWRGRLYVVILIAVVVYWLTPVHLDRNTLYPFVTWIGITIVASYLFREKDSWFLDTRELPRRISLKRVERAQLERVANDALVLPSESGSVALVGHRLSSADKMHTMLELQTNTNMIMQIVEWQNSVLDEYFILKRTTDLSVQTGLTEEVEEWKEQMRIKTGLSEKQSES